MKVIELINKLLEQDLEKQVVLPSVGYDENVGVYEDYSNTDDVAGVELTKKGTVLILS